MRHLNGYKKLGRDTDHRMAMLRNLATSLIIHEKIHTTLPRAKALRSYVEKWLTMGKKGSLHARRQLLSVCYDKDAVAKVFDALAKRYETRPGGYTRVYKLDYRHGDGAQTAIIELVDREEKKTATPTPAKN